MKYQKEREMLCKMQQVYASLFATVNKLQACADVSTGGLTSRQYLLLTTISRMVPEEATLNNIAAKLATSKQNVNKLVATMEQKGFVKVVPSKVDKRAVNASVTKKGEKMIAQCAIGVNQFYADLFKAFPDNEIQDLQYLINKLAAFDGEGMETFEQEKTEGIDIDNQEFETFLKSFSKTRKKIGK